MRGDDQKRRLKVAVIISGICYDSQRRVSEGILHAASHRGDQVVFFLCDAWGYTSRSYRDGEANIYNLLEPEQFDGIILHGDTIQNADLAEKLAERIAKSGVPGIALNHRYSGMMYAGMENTVGMQEIIDHMIDVHGARKLNFISGPKGNYDSEERLQAFRDVLHARGFSLEESQIVEGDYHPHSGSLAVEKWLSEGRENMPDTIVCANDEMALGALYALADAGLRVPEDVRISGYDDAYLGRVHEPAITTVVRRDYELGQAAYWKLRTSIMGEESGDDDTIACHAVFRGSCGCPEDAKSLDRDAVRQMQTMDVKNRTYMINFAEILRSSAVDFSMASAYEDLYRYIRKYARMIDVSDFFLCICREPSREVAENGYLQKGEYREAYEFGKCMYAPVAVVDGHDLACGDFETKELLPQAAWDAATSSYFSVMPVHFQDKCFGYVVIGLNASVKDNDLINLFVMNISNAIENVHKQTQLSSMVEKLNRLYIYDNLTGIMNRSGFNKYVDVVLKDARSDELCVCIFFADLDNLKYINDHMGHDEGDRFIRTIAQIMAQNKHHGELLMRYGGDEFVALAPGVDAEEAKRRIAGLMKELEEVNGRRKQHADDMLFDMSVGFIIIPPEEVQAGIDLDVKIEEADQEMYKVKRAKKEKMIRIIAGREDDRRS